MRLAIFSDIHSNLEALTAAEHLLPTLHIDEIICLGDIIGYGADPNPCIDYIRTHSKLVVRGNHDAAVVQPSLLNFFSRRAAEAVRWTIGRLTPANFEYLASLPLLATAYNCTFVHSSPFQPQEWTYITDPRQTSGLFSSFSTPICFIGHTHIPAIFSEGIMAFSINRGKKFLVNPGSIGQPRDGNPDLSFGILDTERWTFDCIRSPYDIRTAAKKIIDAGLPPALGERLLYGT